MNARSDFQAKTKNAGIIQKGNGKEKNIKGLNLFKKRISEAKEENEETSARGKLQRPSKRCHKS